MTSDIECPVCDRKVSVSSERCPNCGASLTMATFEDLEELAQDIALSRSSPPKGKEPTYAAPAERAKEPETSQVPVASTKPKPNIAEKEPEAVSGPVKVEEEKRPEPVPAPADKAPEDKAEDEGRKGISRIFGRKKK
jgi:hypothetical protein